MAKDQPTPLEPLEEESVYYIEQCEEFPYRGQWVIYSNTKYGKKMFQNFLTEDIAINAAKYYGLNLLSE